MSELEIFMQRGSRKETECLIRKYTKDLHRQLAEAKEEVKRLKGLVEADVFQGPDAPARLGENI